MTNNLSNWKQFKLILWKNWCTQRNNPFYLFMIVVMPALFFITIVVLRVLHEPKIMPATNYQPINIQEAWLPLINEMKRRKSIMNEHNKNFTYNSFVPRLVVCYAPDIFVGFSEIMRHASIYLDDIEIKGFADCGSMRAAMMADSYLAGACFNSKVMTMHPTESIHLIDNYPTRLSFSLIFPSTLRFYNDTVIGAHWNTYTLYEEYPGYKDRARNMNDGGFVGYIREGFISLQNAISMSYIKLITKVNNLPDIVIQRFPFGNIIYDNLKECLATSISMTVMIGFLGPFLQFLRHIVAEKHKKLMPLMQCTGIPAWIHYSAWMIIGVGTMSISSLLIVLTLTTNWLMGVAILSSSSYCVLMLFMISYNIATMSFCLLMSACFTNIRMSISVSSIVWLLTYMPFLMTYMQKDFNLKWLLYFLGNSVMGFGFYNITRMSLVNREFNWSSLIDTESMHENIPLVVYILMFYGSSVIHLVVALYMEKIKFINYLLGKNLSFYLTERRINRFEKTSSDAGRRRPFRMTKVYEMDPSFKEKVIEIKNVSKDYHGEVVLRKISLNLFKNEIVVLMGHNGCGKTTLLSMIMGIGQPTSGEIYINGLEIENNHGIAHQNVGLSLNCDQLFFDLTVMEQIGFFSRLHGMSWAESRKDVQKYLDAMNLNDIKDMYTKDISLTSRKCLAICCALAGNTKIVVLDEPSEGMDLGTRKMFWDMLTLEKFNRTILMTTHCVIEAESLADRIAIMSGGELTCYGSSFFLKQIYGHGFRLTCVKANNCNVDLVTDVIRKHIPNIQPECDLGTELSYAISENNIDIVEEVLKELELNSGELKLTNCQLRQANLGDIFYKIGAEDPSDGEWHRHSNIMNGQTLDYEHCRELTILQEYEPLSGVQLWLNHCRGIFKKRFIYNSRHLFSSIMEVVGPVLVISCTYILWNLGDTKKHLPPLTFNTRQYWHSVTVIESNIKNNNLMKEVNYNYRTHLFWSGTENRIEDTNGVTFSNYILKQQKLLLTTMNKHYHLGVSITDDKIIAWFNNFPLHSAPLSLNMVHNALVWFLLNGNAKIIVTNEPLPSKDIREMRILSAPIDNFLAINISFTLVAIGNMCVFFIVRERIFHFKFLQTITGLSYYSLWLTTLLYETIKYIGISLIFVVIISLYDQFNILHLDKIGWYFLSCFLGVMSITAFNNMLAMFFEDDAWAYISIISINMFGGLSFCALAEINNAGFIHNINYPLDLEWPFLIFPQFSLAKALNKIYQISELHKICLDKQLQMISVTLDGCLFKPNCCSYVSLLIVYALISCLKALLWKIDPMHVWQLKTGIIYEICCMIVIAVLSLVTILLVEYSKLLSFKSIPSTYENYLEYSPEPKEYENAAESSDDVLTEITRIEDLNKSDEERMALICSNVGRITNDKTVLYDINILSERGECFGILGVNDSGKSTLLKILTGNEEMTYGNIIIHGLNMKLHPRKVYQLIGFCPQYHALPKEYTGNEILEIFCLLHGIPRKHIEEILTTLTKRLNLFVHGRKNIGEYSVGMQTRLRCAVAVIGNPSLLFFDEPTSYVDLAGKRQIWNIFCEMRDQGKSILFSSVNANECELMCDRMAILTNGQFWCIGETQFLIRKYSIGYIVRLKLKRALKRNSRYSNVERQYTTIEQFMANEFPNSQLKVLTGHTMTYILPLDALDISTIFNKLHSNSFYLRIETFDITHETLDFLYSDISKLSKRGKRISE